MHVEMIVIYHVYSTAGHNSVLESLVVRKDVVIDTLQTSVSVLGATEI